MTLRALGIVPARAGSKRVPGKNRRELGGKPLFAWALEAALDAATLSDVVVSSDDKAILAYASRYPKVVPLLRPAELATDTAPAIAFVKHALGELEARGALAYASVAILQPTSPFTLSKDVDATMNLLSESGAASVVTVMAVEHAIHPLKLKRLVGDKLEPYLEDEAGRMAEHELTKVYVRNGAVYAARRATIAAGAIVDDDCRAVVMPRERSLDINDETDFAFAEFMLARRGQNR